MVARRFVIAGQVQGVGYRPFVYRLAHALGVRGWVRNTAGQVEILAHAAPGILDRFRARLIGDAPPLARPELRVELPADGAPLDGFRILASDVAGARDIHVPPDHFACDDCLRELRDPGDRRYRYPFINCTQCGPRYTIIDRLPYDRANTTMAGFKLCPACRVEYENPLDRRFHAEPVACPACGPSLRITSPRIDPTHDGPGEGTIVDASAVLAAAVGALIAGDIVAVRGIGGYHLMCDATNETAVARLRTRKHRPHKPLAVMLPQTGMDGGDWVRRVAVAGAVELAALRDPRRPIVLCAKRADAPLAASIAPGLNEVGLFLPYSPLHHLLLDDFGGPLVATSANLTGEPVMTEPQEVEQRLGAMADAFLHHDRPIRRPADDAVCRVIAGRARPLRIGRGTAPLELTLPRSIATPTLAVGGHLKNTVALAWEDRVVVSPHIGELDSPRALTVFAQVIDDLQRLYGMRAERIVCDAHPQYASTRWARAQNLPVTAVYHHHAHAATVAGEYGIDEAMLVFAWDGTGYGVDGTLWGGEGLLGRPGAWRRVASFRPFRLPGGDRAGREPWRAAAALCWETGVTFDRAPAGAELGYAAWQRGVNCPHSSAVGRLFDAAAALLGLCESASFEGQGPMLLEAAATVHEDAEALPLIVDDTGVLRADWAPLLGMLRDDAISVAVRAARFHEVLAQTLLSIARTLRDRHGIATVGLSGGVFQNRKLGERVMALLVADGFRALLPERIPCNDAGLSYGQIIETGMHWPHPA